MLDQIIRTDGGDNWWKPNLFETKTLPRLPKELEVLGPPLEYDKNYNCFIYVLGLGNDSAIIKETGGFIYDTFFQKLIDEKVLTPTKYPQKRDYVLYSDAKKYPGVITHSGLVDEDNFIISKWAWGPLLRHKVTNIPESYGDDISYFKAIPREHIHGLYEKYKAFNIKPE